MVLWSLRLRVANYFRSFPVAFNYSVNHNFRFGSDLCRQSQFEAVFRTYHPAFILTVILA